ncbi:hypothetical protein BU17DRAFT_70602 [Hysterangium stoloniferum]|nr:hypothetical protein BU17DRAFT_70602 [Hysterangium stoloniferum]
MGGTRKTIRGSRGQFIATTRVTEPSIPALAAPQNRHPKLRPIFKDAATKNLQNQQNDPEIDVMCVANVLLEMKKGSSAAIHNKKQEAGFRAVSGTTTHTHGYHKNNTITGDLREDYLAEGSSDIFKDASDYSQEYDEVENDGENMVSAGQVKNIFKIRFEIPYGAATRDLRINSDARYTDFLVDLADSMGLKVSNLRVGYIFSFLPKSPKPKPKLLESEKCWNILIRDLATWIEAEKRKNKGKGIVRPWSVRIEDLNKDIAVTHGKRKKIPTDDVNQPALQRRMGDSADAFTKEHDIIKDIEKYHACNKCNAACTTLPKSRDHYVYTMADKAIWANLVKSQGKASITKPPTSLDLTPRIQLRDLKAKLDDNSAVTETQKLLAEMRQLKDFVLPMALNQPEIKFPKAAVPTPYTPIRVGDEGSASPKNVYKAESHKMASEVDYPTLEQWLGSLDVHSLRGRDNQNYSRFHPLFIEQGFLRLDDLADLSGKDLLDLFEQHGMNAGTANRLIRWAKEDSTILSVEPLRKKSCHE